MGKMRIDGYEFEGPYIVDKDEMPSFSGIALICTEAGEGEKILAIINGHNISQLISESPDKQFWKDNAYHGEVKIYAKEFDDSKRESVSKSMIDKRLKFLTCQRVEVIQDDW